MMTYAIAKHSPPTAELARMLEAHGARKAADVATADVVLLAADAISDLAAALANLGPMAGKTIALGALGPINAMRRREPGTLEITLETYRPLGVFQWPRGFALDGRMSVGFLGPKALADRPGDSYVKHYSTDHYGSWVRRDDMDAGAFVLRLLTAPQITHSKQGGMSR